MFELWWFFLPLGAFVGVAAGLLGVGGGLIMVPSFVWAFAHMSLPEASLMQYALGSSMAGIVATSFASMMAHRAKQSILWPVVYAMSPGVLVGAYSATAIVSIASGKLLSVLFALFMGYVAMQMVLNKKPAPSRTLPHRWGLLGMGGVGGGVSALFSIGGGTINVPFLTWCNVPLPTAIGTSAALGLPIAVAGTLGYIVNAPNTEQAFTQGYIYWPAVAMVSVTAALFARLGAVLAHSLPTAVVKRVFATLIVILTLRLLASFWL